MRRKGQQIPQDECIRILEQEKRGSLSVNGDDGYPYCVPINYYFDSSENAVFFHNKKISRLIFRVDRHQQRYVQ